LGSADFWIKAEIPPQQHLMTQAGQRLTFQVNN
jgi:hypothetical protein